jgi:CO dehydrogenase maturation factor
MESINAAETQAMARNFAVLVVDSDESNPGLFRMLGFTDPPRPLIELVGGKAQAKEKMAQGTLLNEDQIFLKKIPCEYRRERDGLFQVSIGKILQAMEGCACPMGALTREFLKRLRLNENEIAIIDMEAGVEHFGRGIEQAIDTVLVVVEPSLDSLAVAEKVSGLAAGMNKKVSAVLNKAPSGPVNEKLKEELRLPG